MSFIWPLALLGLLLVPISVVVYRRLVRSRANGTPARRLGLGSTQTSSSGFRSHLPIGLFMLAITALLVGFARPRATIDVPQIKSTVILAFDTSSSMVADDLEPTRLDAAKVAAIEFMEQQPGSVEIGVVSFGTGGVVTLRPSDDRVAVQSAIERLEPAGGTSLSEGLFASLSAIAKGPLLFDPELPDDEQPPIDFGGFGSAIILMFSDGEDTTEQDPTPIAELASSAGIRVFPVGLGSEEGAVIELDGFSVGTVLEEETLQDIAARTNGTYFRATETEELAPITDSVERELTVEPEDIEITALFATSALVLAAIAGGLRLFWTGRMP